VRQDWLRLSNGCPQSRDPSLTTDAGTERIEAISRDGQNRFVIIEHAVTPVWSPTGHLLFGRDGAVWAVPFDPKSATTSAAAVPVIPSGLVGRVRSGSLGFQLSSTGTLVFVPADFDFKRVVSVGRNGSEVALNLPPNRYANPRISPDGRRFSIESTGSVIELLDLARGTRTRLTTAALRTNFSTRTAAGGGVVFRRFNVPFTGSRPMAAAEPAPCRRDASTTFRHPRDPIPIPLSRFAFSRKRQVTFSCCRSAASSSRNCCS
jgi:Tol biopolymer transport system component